MDYTKILYSILGVKLGNPMHQNTFGKASTSGVASVPGILPVQLCLVQSLGRLYVPLPRTFLGFFLCNYICLVQSLGRFYVPLPFTGWGQRSLVYSCATLPYPEPWPVLCFTSVHLSQRGFNLGNIPATSRSCSITSSSYLDRMHSTVQ